MLLLSREAISETDIHLIDLFVCWRYSATPHTIMFKGYVACMLSSLLFHAQFARIKFFEFFDSWTLNMVDDLILYLFLLLSLVLMIAMTHLYAFEICFASTFNTRIL